MFDIITFTFWLLLFFQAKHFVADYPLQGKYMLGKFKPGWDFFLPLLAHVGVHGAMTLALCLWVAPHFWWLALVDMCVHFVMDRIKAGPKYLGRFKPLTARQFKLAAEEAYSKWEDKREKLEKVHPSWALDELKDIHVGLQKAGKKQIRDNALFWWSLGLDQMVHHLTHYLIIYILVLDKFLIW